MRGIGTHTGSGTRSRPVCQDLEVLTCKRTGVERVARGLPEVVTGAAGGAHGPGLHEKRGVSWSGHASQPSWVSGLGPGCYPTGAHSDQEKVPSCGRGSGCPGDEGSMRRVKEPACQRSRGSREMASGPDPSHLALDPDKSFPGPLGLGLPDYEKPSLGGSVAGPQPCSAPPVPVGAC